MPVKESRVNLEFCQAAKWMKENPELAKKIEKIQ